MSHTICESRDCSVLNRAAGPVGRMRARRSAFTRFVRELDGLTDLGREREPTPVSPGSRAGGRREGCREWCCREPPTKTLHYTAYL